MNPAFCTECGGRLEDRGNGYLVCPNCGCHYAAETPTPAPVYEQPVYEYETVQTPQPPKKSGGKKIIAILTALILVAALVLGIVFVVLPMLEEDDRRTGSSHSRRDDDDEEDEDEEEEEDEDEEAEVDDDEVAFDDTQEDMPEENVPETTAPEVTEEESQPEATQPQDPMAALQVGDTFTFGSYEQDGNYANGAEAVEWIVLAREDDRILVISRYTLDSQQYHSRHAAVAWADCDLRFWLNGTFFDLTFSEVEQERILTTVLPGDTNPTHGTAGEDTEDRIFLLSVEEAELYFAREEDRHCVATPYAVSQGAFVSSSNGGSWWFLRTPGYDLGHITNVNSNGSIDLDGAEVESGMGTIRPAMWIRIG